MKIVINHSYGSFGVSENFFKEYNIPYGKSNSGRVYPKTEMCIRTDARLIEYIEKHGSEMASAYNAKLVIKEVPKGAYFIIDDYEGFESIMIRDEIKWHIAT